MTEFGSAPQWREESLVQLTSQKELSTAKAYAEKMNNKMA